jgi:hypothetical protein
MNFEAENMIDRLIWRRFLPGAIVIAFLIIVLVVLSR